MNRLGLALAVVLTIAGFGVALIIDASKYDVAGTAADTRAGSSKPESAAAPPPSCVDTENALRELVEDARSCSSDSDCTLFDFGYPIDCMTSIAKSDVTALRVEYRRYDRDCEYRVFYDCPTEPMRRRAVCRQNRCEVSLENTDSLEDETLEHLGITRSATGGRED